MAGHSGFWQWQSKLEFGSGIGTWDLAVVEHVDFDRN